MSPARRRRAVKGAMRDLRVSERRACRVLGQNRAVQRYTPIPRDDEGALTKRIVELPAVYGRYGTPRITALLRHEGWIVNHKRVDRIWRREGLKAPRKQPKRGRLWLNDGSCVRLSLSAVIMSGRTPSCRHGQQTVSRCGCLSLSTSLRACAWRSMSPAPETIAARHR